jgi:hypothetical protein
VPGEIGQFVKRQRVGLRFDFGNTHASKVALRPGDSTDDLAAGDRSRARLIRRPVARLGEIGGAGPEVNGPIVERLELIGKKGRGTGRGRGGPGATRTIAGQKTGGGNGARSRTIRRAGCEQGEGRRLRPTGA